MGAATARRAIAPVFIVVFLAAPHAHANAGTPIMWASSLHLFLGNALLGLFEGLLLARLFGIDRTRAVWLLIAANYASAWLGLLIIGGMAGLWPPTPHNLGFLMGSTLVALAAATLVFEYPFILVALRGGPRLFRRTLAADAVLQGVSYLLLSPFLLLQVWSLFAYRDVEMDSSLAYVDNRNACVFFIGEDGNVYRTRVSGGPAEKILEASADDYRDTLMARRNEATDRWDLLLKRDPNEATVHPLNILVQARFAEFAAESEQDWRPSEPEEKVRGPWAQDLRAADARDWQVRSSGMLFSSLWARNEQTGQTVRVAIDSLWTLWGFSHITALPHEEVVVQWGPNICVLDLRERKLGLIARGYSPVVGLDEPPPPASLLESRRPSP